MTMAKRAIVAEIVANEKQAKWDIRVRRWKKKCRIWSEKGLPPPPQPFREEHDPDKSKVKRILRD